MLAQSGRHCASASKMKKKARLLAKRCGTAGGTLPYAYIGGHAICWEEHEAPTVVSRVHGVSAPDEEGLAGVSRAEGLLPEAEEGVRVQDGRGALGLEEDLSGRSRLEESSEAEERRSQR